MRVRVRVLACDSHATREGCQVARERHCTSEMERVEGAGPGTLLPAAVVGVGEGSGRVDRRSYIVSLYSSRKDILEEETAIITGAHSQARGGDGNNHRGTLSS